MTEQAAMRAVTKLSDWVLAPLLTVADEPTVSHHADAVPIEEWLEEIAASLGDIDPGDVLKAMVADGFSADDARFLLLAALARYGSQPLVDLSAVPAVRYLRGVGLERGAQIP